MARDRRAAEGFLWSHRTEGGFSTYRPDSSIRQYIGAGDQQSIAGWTAPHPDVTAAALLPSVPPERRRDAQAELAKLLARQRGAGFFDAYWWRGPHYTTALTLRALSRYRRRLPDDQAERLLRALEREQLADGGYGLGSAVRLDPFTTALALESLCHLAYLGGATERAAAGAALLAAQAGDGGWPGDFVMRIPAPDVVDPTHVTHWTPAGGGGNSYVFDQEGQFATALASHALAHWQVVETGDARERARRWRTLEPLDPATAEDVLVVSASGSR